MANSSEKVKLWRERTKERIVQSFGSCCGLCGYNRCNDALELHHLDPKEKEFGFGSIRANPKSWTKIVVELRKCVLLCSNCHREVHYGLHNDLSKCPLFDESFEDYKSKQRQENIDKCPVCNKDKFMYNKTCSLTCGAKLKYTIKWQEFDLFDLFVNQKLSKLKISKIVGCSDNAVAKRLKKLGILKDVKSS